MGEDIISKSNFESEIRLKAREFGGFYNAHAHGDRAFTGQDEFYSKIGHSVEEIKKLTLFEKQGLVWALHQGKGFEPECIEARMRRLLEDSIRCGVTKLDTTVDVTYNSKFRSLEVAEKLKKEYADRIKVQIGAYNVSGFRRYGCEERFEIFEEAAKRADFIVALAEKDSTERKNRDSRERQHIGERQHNAYMLNLALRFGKPVQFHVDQAHDPDEARTELLLNDIYETLVVQNRLEPEEYPEMSAVHVISPSCYPEERFKKLCDGLLEYGVKVICCPTAGISMKQNRVRNAPLNNSLARVWDFALVGIPVSLGTDNIDDVFVPASSPDLFDEVHYLANVLRMYNTRALAKVACGKELDGFDIGSIRNSLYPQS